MVEYLFKARETILQLRDERNDAPKGENIKLYFKVADTLEDYYYEFSTSIAK